MASKPRLRVQAPSRKVPARVQLPAARPKAFDAGKTGRRMLAVPSSTVAINALIRQYGRTVLARSRYLAANNPQTIQAKEVFVSALVGTGIKPSPLIQDPVLKKEMKLTWFDWTDESDADGLTDLYGQQGVVGTEMFEAGECFVRLRARRVEDGLVVPFQLQLLPAEMLDLADNRDLGNGRRVEMGIEFDAIGRRVAYHFWRQHPGASNIFGSSFTSLKTVVPADEVIHVFKPIRAGQIRGIPHILSAIITAAALDAYNDAELERKRIAALFSAFITSDAPEEESTLDTGVEQAKSDGVSNGIGLEPGATVELDPGQDIKFAEPADVGGNYEAFQYRTFLMQAAGMGVPYADMTGDLRQSSYGSQRGGMITFKRRIEPMQHAVIVFQFCRPVWRRFVADAVLVGAVPISPAMFQVRRREFLRVKWITPKWEWIDPLKDLMAEVLAMKAGIKSRSDVIEALGDDPEETDARIAADKKREQELGLDFAESQFFQQALATALQPDPQPAQDKQDGA
ncbi:phage portal protein [Mesorhizobium sp. WSM4962]|uniref:phage portal protein n=1 Tax=Mesorhizobium sp. WSM4962 TaxID=3038548 RepID=UPI002415D02C|nr:phage portal protein [Mesorhizobium sp. WSM4962]MDG4903197.1 phage portal protein [Mesorhizobium sp. WSM4962]